MKFGLSVPNKGNYSDINLLIEIAQLAEEAGWDGYFLWDHVAGPAKVQFVDPWISISAIATLTTKMRLGIMVTPLPRRRPWKVAREIVALDSLSKGRMILGVGLGYFTTKEFEEFGEVSDPRVRGEMLDEALEIIVNLQTGEPVSFVGKHYQISGTVFLPVPLQRPHVPVWVGGVWPNKPPFRRAARWNGVIPLAKGKGYAPLNIAEFNRMKEYTLQHRTLETPFDFCLGGRTEGKNLAKDKSIIHPYQDAGLTWWLESIPPTGLSVKRAIERVRVGPPR
jgi:hypothetical protein